MENQEIIDVSKRSFLERLITVTPVLVFGPTLLSEQALYAALPGIIKRAKDPKNLTDHEKMHIPKLGLPPIAEDGAIVPAYVEVDHPMTDDHYIKSAEILFYTDPIVQKGKFHFSPALAKAFLSTQIRLGESGQVVCITECNQHGKWIGVSEVKVTVGGC